jgi:hypothetical protein
MTTHDPVKVAPKMYKVLLENHRVRVLEARVKPGVTAPMHSHPGSVVYFALTRKPSSRIRTARAKLSRARLVRSCGMTT